MTHLPLDVDLLDPRLVNIILEHSLTSESVRDSRVGYSGDDPSYVVLREGRFPSDVVPELEGFRFRRWDAERDGSLVATESYLLLSYWPYEGRGYNLLVGFTNVGGKARPEGGRMIVFGAATHRYDVDRSGDALRVTFVGTDDS